MALHSLIHALLLVGTDLLPPALLQAQVEAFAGKTALVDPRLLLPACPRPDFAMATGGRSVLVRCSAPDWRVFIPVGEGGAISAPASTLATAPNAGAIGVPLDVAERTSRPAPAVRRGDQVTVEVGGDGFVIGMATTADADARDGRVALRANVGGRRLYGIIGDDGRVRLRDLSTVVNGR